MIRTLGEVVSEYRTWAKNPRARIGTGFSILDSRTSGGITQGEMLMFLARSGVGKTTFALNVASRNAERPMIFFSLEMHARYIAHKLAAVHFNVPTWEIERSVRNTGTHPALDKLAEAFPQLVIVDDPGMSFRDMGATCEAFAEQYGTPPVLGFIDFLELVGGVNSLEALGQVDKAARKAKDFARAEDLALVCLHQVGRGAGGEGHEPLTATSGRFGGEVSADYIMAAYRPSLSKDLTERSRAQLADQIYLQFLKTRGGHELHQHGMRHRIEPETMRITDLTVTSYSHQQYDEADLGLVEGA